MTSLAEFYDRRENGSVDRSAASLSLAVVAPLTAALLLEEEYQGKQRQGSTLLVYGDAGVLKACFCDRDKRRQFWWVVGGLESFWVDLEQKLCDQETEWRKVKDFSRKR